MGRKPVCFGVKALPVDVTIPVCIRLDGSKRFFPVSGGALLSAEVTDLPLNWLLPQKGSAVQSG